MYMYIYTYIFINNKVLFPCFKIYAKYIILYVFYRNLLFFAQCICEIYLS